MRQQSDGPTGRSLAFALVLALAFGGLAVVAHHAEAGTAVDHWVLSWMIEHRQRWLTTVAIVITDAGSPVAMTLLAFSAAGLLWWRQSSPRSAVVVIATMAVATATSTLTKFVVDAHRPPEAVRLIPEVDPSFPSGHVTGAVTLLGMLAFVVGRHRGTAVRLALVFAATTLTTAIAATRLYLGVHWLIDVSGGLLLGGVAVVISTSFLAADRRSHQYQGRRHTKSPASKVTQVA